MTRLTITKQDDPTYPYVTDNGRLFRTREEAQAYAEDWDAFCAAYDPIPRDSAGNWLIPFPMERDQYEEWAARAGVEPWTDAQIRHNAYGILYYEPQEANRETGLHALRCRLAGRRLAKLEHEDRMRVTPPPAPSTATCSTCGARLSTYLLLTSPIGAVCPDCFDDTETA